MSGLRGQCCGDLFQQLWPLVLEELNQFNHGIHVLQVCLNAGKIDSKLTSLLKLCPCEPNLCFRFEHVSIAERQAIVWT